MTFIELVGVISKKTELSKTQVREVLTSFTDILQSNVMGIGGTVTLPKLGKFVRFRSKPRSIRIPKFMVKSSDVKQVPARDTLKFVSKVRVDVPADGV